MGKIYPNRYPNLNVTGNAEKLITILMIWNVSVPVMSFKN